MKKPLALLMVLVMTIAVMPTIAFAAAADKYLVGNPTDTDKLYVSYDNMLEVAQAITLPSSQAAVINAAGAYNVTGATLKSGQSAPATLFTGESAKVRNISWPLLDTITTYELVVSYDTGAGVATAGTTFTYPALANPQPTPGTYNLVVTADKTVPTTQTVTLTCSTQVDMTGMRIQDPTGNTGTVGQSSRTYAATTNGTYTFHVLDGSNAIKDSINFTVSNISGEPVLGTPTYSSISANKMTVTVPTGQWNSMLYQLDTTALPADTSASMSGSTVIVIMPNTTATRTIRFKNLETQGYKDLTLSAQAQPVVTSGPISFVDYTLQSLDERDMTLRLNFDNMSGYTFDTKSIGSSYKATVSGPNSIDITLKGFTAAVTLKPSFVDSSGTKHHVSFKVYPAPTVASVTPTDLSRKTTTYKFTLSNMTSSFFSLDTSQYDSEYKAKYSSSHLTLTLDNEDQMVDIEVTDKYDNVYKLEYDLVIDNLKKASKIQISDTRLIKYDDDARVGTYEVTFTGISGLDLEVEELEDYEAKKISNTVYHITVPYGTTTIEFPFYDDNGEQYLHTHVFELSDESAWLDDDDEFGPTSNSPVAGTTKKSPLTGGTLQGLDILINAVR